MLQRDFYVGDYIGRHVSGNNFPKFRKNFLDEAGGKTPKLHYKWTFDRKDSQTWTTFLQIKPFIYAGGFQATAALGYKLPRMVTSMDWGVTQMTIISGLTFYIVGRNVYRWLQDYEKNTIGNFYVKYKKPFNRYVFSGDIRVFGEDYVMVKGNDGFPEQDN